MAEMVRKAFVYRAYPTKEQTVALELALSEAARLYNAALQERREAWRMRRESIWFAAQAAQLKDIRAAGDLGLANAWCAADVLRRVDRAFKRFFARRRSGESAGFPRFRSAERYDSLCFRYVGKYANGCGFDGPRRVKFQGIGSVKLKLHRPIEGQIKTVAIRRSAGQWFVNFSVEIEPKPLQPSIESVGIDVGLEHFATLSDGTTVANPRFARAGQAMLRRAQRRVSRRRIGSERRQKAKRRAARAYARVANQRRDFHHKTARDIVSGFGLISVERLNVKSLSRAMFSKSIGDAGWASFINVLADKAAEAGRSLMRVNPRGTSQSCLCGHSVPKTLKDRWHSCDACGLSLPRDLVSAMLIDRLGKSRHALSATTTALA